MNPRRPGVFTCTVVVGKAGTVEGRSLATSAERAGAKWVYVKMGKHEIPHEANVDEHHFLYGNYYLELKSSISRHPNRFLHWHKVEAGFRQASWCLLPQLPGGGNGLTLYVMHVMHVMQPICRANILRWPLMVTVDGLRAQTLTSLVDVSWFHHFQWKITDFDFQMAWKMPVKLKEDGSIFTVTSVTLR